MLIGAECLPNTSNANANTFYADTVYKYLIYIAIWLHMLHKLISQKFNSDFIIIVKMSLSLTMLLEN